MRWDMKKDLNLMALAFVAALLSHPAHAAKTGWFKGKERYEIEKRLKGKLLLEIECRDGRAPGLHLAKDEFRVTYSDNPSNTKFLWAIGNVFGAYKKRAEKRGFKLVSYNQYVRASGLKIPCAVWHKK